MKRTKMKISYVASKQLYECNTLKIIFIRILRIHHNSKDEIIQSGSVCERMDGIEPHLVMDTSPAERTAEQHS